MKETRVPAEVQPLAFFLCEEMEARDWTTDDVAMRMGGSPDDVARNMLLVALIISVHKDNLVIPDDTFVSLANAFDVHPDFFRNLDAAWRSNPDQRVSFDPPEALYGPLTASGFQ